MNTTGHDDNPQIDYRSRKQRVEDEKRRKRDAKLEKKKSRDKAA